MLYDEQTMYAFLDESGAYGWNLEDPSCGSHLVNAAIIVHGQYIAETIEKIQAIKQKFFSNTEMKSSAIKDDSALRRRILSQLYNAPFKVMLCIVDKGKMKDFPQVQYREEFYKYINSCFYEFLKITYPNLVVCADELISSEYMKSFIDYVKEKENHDLFGATDFRFENSKNNILIQLADIVSGSVRRTYDATIKEKYDYAIMWKDKILDTLYFPESWHDYTERNPAGRKEFDSQIARISFEQAVLFFRQYKAIRDKEERARVLTLRFLLTQMINKNNKYIQTKDIKKHLESFGLNLWSTQAFRNKIIAKMRDQNVLITSSPHGYKIPTSEEELYSFINHGNSIVEPMLKRLIKCHKIIRNKTLGHVNLLEREEYRNLRKYMESQEE